jgi:putative heme d1 biosynthesis radical SAM protein NirJ2
MNMILSWNVTRACNLRCRHCYRDAGPRDPDELTTGEAIGLIDEIARAGFAILILSGGEPLLRDDLCELIAHAARRGMKPVLGTNGTLLDTAAAARLKAAGLARAGISLDSVDPEVHDGFRRMPGAWDLAVGATRACSDAGLDFQIHTTVAAHNLAGLSEITDFAARLGALAHHIFFLVPTGRGKEIAGFSISPTEQEHTLRQLLEKQRSTALEIKPVCAPQFLRIAREMKLDTRFKRGCLAGISYCCVLPGGDVHPCPYLPLRIGNVRETALSTLWRGNPVFDLMRGMEYSGACGRCGARESCGGCRARALFYRGELMAEDPGCLRAMGEGSATA